MRPLACWRSTRSVPPICRANSSLRRSSSSSGSHVMAAQHTGRPKALENEADYGTARDRRHAHVPIHTSKVGPMKRSHVVMLVAAVTAIACATPAVGKKVKNKVQVDVVTMVRRAFHIASRSDANARKALTTPVDSARIVDGNVTSPDIAGGAVTSSKLAADSVFSANVVDGAIAAPDLADGSVTGAKIADGSVGGAKLAS